MRSEAGERAVDAEIRARGEGAGVPREVDGDRLKLLRLAEPVQRGDRLPLLNQRNERRTGGQGRSADRQSRLDRHFHRSAPRFSGGQGQQFRRPPELHPRLRRGHFCDDLRRAGRCGCGEGVKEKLRRLEGEQLRRLVGTEKAERAEGLAGV